jgi:hypothetical protein
LAFDLALLEVGMGMGQVVVESIKYLAVCRDCGAWLECCGVQALVGSSLRWDVEATCSACGFAVAVCDDVLSADLRDQMLSEHGPARLRVTSPQGRSIAIMWVLRAELGLGPAGARTALGHVLPGEFSGTLSEMELLARKLREAGISAASTRP